MRFCVIASGSKGNMTYVEGGSTKLLIDTGITLTAASKRCSDIDFSKITDILITHEHSDHIHFIDTVLKKTDANLYISKKSFMNFRKDLINRLKGYNIKFIEEESRYFIGDFEVLTLALSHDCADIFGYIINHQGKSLAYVTDTGVFPNRYKELLKKVDGLIIEANHNVEMLINSDRDIYLINRILSAKGHLSNQVCFELLNEYLTNQTKYVILAHVSEDCNNDECLENEIIMKLKGKYEGEILIARQKEAIQVIEL